MREDEHAPPIFEELVSSPEEFFFHFHFRFIFNPFFFFH